MVLIIGGVYQGKLDFATRTLGITAKEIYSCTDTRIDFSKRCIYHIEEFVLACVQQGIDPTAYFAEHQEEWQNSILICCDIFCGIVPMDPIHRAWRQKTGRLCQYLSAEACQVSRIFCGIEQRLK